MIYLIRHGQTEQNNRKILTGRANYQLNETGLAQARGAGVWLRERNIHVDLVYASPLDRALDTAALAAPGVETRIDERLIEMEFGPYEGMDLLHPAPEVKAFFSDFEHNPPPEGMEPLHEITARLGALLEELKPLAAEKANKSVIAYPENCQSCGQCFVNCLGRSLTIVNDMYGYAQTSYRAATTVAMNRTAQKVIDR
jgi:broad specificity phosphatase PhoE